MTLTLPTTRTLKIVCVPTEHGGWGFLAEPVIVGLTLAPSLQGLWLCVAALAAFLARRPLTLLWRDVTERRHYPRTDAALLSCGTFGLLAALAATAGLGRAALVPVLLAVPFALVFLYHDLARHVRTLSGELCGAVAMGALAPAVMVSGGRPLSAALAIWALLALHSITSILLVRAHVQRLHRQTPSYAAALGAHVVALVTAILFVACGLASLFVPAAFALLLGRALYSLRVPPTDARTVGWTEMAWTLAFVVLVTA